MASIIPTIRVGMTVLEFMESVEAIVGLVYQYVEVILDVNFLTNLFK